MEPILGVYIYMGPFYASGLVRPGNRIVFFSHLSKSWFLKFEWRLASLLCVAFLLRTELPQTSWSFMVSLLCVVLGYFSKSDVGWDVELRSSVTFWKSG